MDSPIELDRRRGVTTTLTCLEKGDFFTLPFLSSSSSLQVVTGVVVVATATGTVVSVFDDAVAGIGVEAVAVHVAAEIVVVGIAVVGEIICCSSLLLKSLSTLLFSLLSAVEDEIVIIEDVASDTIVAA